MASWKKVIVSGSNADLAQITSSAGILNTGDLTTLGSTFLGDSQSDKHHITGSLFVSSSKNIFTGEVTASRIYIEGGGIDDTRDLYLKNGEVELNLNNGGAAFQIKKQNDGSSFLRLGLSRFYIFENGVSGKDFRIGSTSNIGGAPISIDGAIGTSNSLKVGVGRDNTDLGLTVTGSTDISGSLRVDGTLTVTGDTLQEDLSTTGTTKLGNDMSDKTEVTGSFNVTGSSFFNGTGTFSGSNGTVTIDPYSNTVIDIQDSAGGSLELMKFRDSTGNDQIRLRRNGGQNSLELLDNSGNSVKLDSKNDGFYLNNFAIGASSADANNTLSVTGNIKASTGITGSYLTDNKLLTAGSVGQIESSAVTWNDTTLTIGSSGAGHVYATQVTASEVKISSLAADRIVFVNSTNQLEDSTNLQYDDDGGLNVGGKLSLTGDLIVSHNLTVQGTASFQNTEDLDVKDRFIRMASGSTTTGDGGFAVQQTGPLDTEGFGYDSALQRWGVTSSFDASQNALNPAAFMPMTINGTENVPTSNQVANETRYKKAGNMYIDTNATSEEGGVWIYV